MKTIKYSLFLSVALAILVVGIGIHIASAQVMGVSCDAAPGCSYPQRTSTDCGPEVCSGSSSDPVVTPTSSVSCDAPAGCSYPNRTSTSCGTEVCSGMNSDPVYANGPITQCQQAVPPTGCQYVNADAHGCNAQLVCQGVNTDPVMSSGARQSLIAIIKQKIAILEQILAVLLKIQSITGTAQ